MVVSGILGLSLVISISGDLLSSVLGLLNPVLNLVLSLLSGLLGSL